MMTIVRNLLMLTIAVASTACSSSGSSTSTAFDREAVRAGIVARNSPIEEGDVSRKLSAVEEACRTHDDRAMELTVEAAHDSEDDLLLALLDGCPDRVESAMNSLGISARD